MNVLRKYQTFWPRFWAGWIDGAVFLPLWFVDSWINAGAPTPTVLAVWFFFNASVFDIYEVVMHAKYGQTLGKMFMGVKVLDLSESKLSWRQAILRDIVPIAAVVLAVVDGLPRVLAGMDPYKTMEMTWVEILQIFASLPWFVAELITMLLNSKRRAVHDLIAGSVVVRVAEFEVERNRDAVAA